MDLLQKSSKLPILLSPKASTTNVQGSPEQAIAVKPEYEQKSLFQGLKPSDTRSTKEKDNSARTHVTSSTFKKDTEEMDREQQEAKQEGKKAGTEVDGPG